MMAKSGVTMTVNKVGKVLAGMELLTKREVLVGVPAAKGPRQDGDPITNAEIAYIMEYGAPEVNIPARPTIIPGVRACEAKVRAYLKVAAAAGLAGDVPRIMRALNAAGLTAQASIRNQFTSGQFIPLAPRTIQARLRRGRTGTMPLIDTGQFRNSINYVIREKGK
jgi:hypothetical protein